MLPEVLDVIIYVIIYETLAEAFFLCASCYCSYSKNACMHAVLSLHEVVIL